MNNILVKIFGFHSLLVHGSPMFTDRWFWLKKRLNNATHGQKLIDVGCGSGALTIYAAKKGYQAVGLSYADAHHKAANIRARLCGVPEVKFINKDIRNLSSSSELYKQFDCIICFETIEHILNDQQFMKDLNKLLKINGTLLLTTPNYAFIPLNKEDARPPSMEEDGGHVRKGYIAQDFHRLCQNSGFAIQEISYCSGFISQKITAIWRFFQFLPQIILFPLTLFLRTLPFVFFDNFLTKVIHYPFYSICMIADKVNEIEE